MDEATLLSGIARLEKLATAYGPQVLATVQTVADTLSGPQAAGTGSAGNDAPVASHLGTRLNSVAVLLEGLFDTIKGHASRAGSAVGVQG